MRLTEAQKQIIIDNPDMPETQLADLFKCHKSTISRFRTSLNKPKKSCKTVANSDKIPARAIKESCELQIEKCNDDRERMIKSEKEHYEDMRKLFKAIYDKIVETGGNPDDVWRATQFSNSMGKHAALIGKWLGMEQSINNNNSLTIQKNTVIVTNEEEDFLDQCYDLDPTIIAEAVARANNGERPGSS